MRSKREKILLPPNSRKHADFDLLIEQPITGMKCKNNAYRKVNGASTKHSRCNTPAYAHPPLKTHKPTPENLLNADIKETPVRPLFDDDFAGLGGVVGVLLQCTFGSFCHSVPVQAWVGCFRVCCCNVERCFLLCSF